MARQRRVITSGNLLRLSSLIAKRSNLKRRLILVKRPDVTSNVLAQKANPAEIFCTAWIFMDCWLLEVLGLLKMDHKIAFKYIVFREKKAFKNTVLCQKGLLKQSGKNLKLRKNSRRKQCTVNYLGSWLRMEKLLRPQNEI